MKPMVSVGEAHISSIVAAYEVGTLTSKVRPVAWFSASAMISPPATITCASTDGTNRTLIGCSGLPMSGIGSAVGSRMASGGGGRATARGFGAARGHRLGRRLGHGCGGGGRRYGGGFGRGRRARAQGDRRQNEQADGNKDVSLTHGALSSSGKSDGGGLEHGPLRRARRGVHLLLRWGERQNHSAIRGPLQAGPGGPLDLVERGTVLA